MTSFRTTTSLATKMMKVYFSLVVLRFMSISLDTNSIFMSVVRSYRMLCANIWSWKMREKKCGKILRIHGSDAVQENNLLIGNPARKLSNLSPNELNESIQWRV